MVRKTARKQRQSFGDWLRRLREEQGLSLRAVAKAAQISPTYLSQLERDRSRPTERVVFNLAEVLKCNGDELLALLGQIAGDLQSVILKQPGEIGALLLAVDGLPAAEINQLADRAEHRKAELGIKS